MVVKANDMESRHEINGERISELLRQTALHYLLLEKDIKDLGLYQGKIGLSLFYFMYARYSGNSILEDYAEELFYEVFANVSSETSICFGDGLAGIGWTIIYLYQNHYIDGEIRDLLCSIDHFIMQKDIRRIDDLSFEYGLDGINNYVQSRLKMKGKHGFDNNFLNELLRKCQSCNLKSSTYSLADISIDVSKKNIRLWNQGICLIINN